MFGDTTTVGLRIGNDTATVGGSVSFGYKAHSVALIPVSVLQRDGYVRRLQGFGPGTADDPAEADAMSVFATFEVKAPITDPKVAATNVQLGQVFSTGLAAQAVALGYLCRATPDACDATRTQLKDARNFITKNKSEKSADSRSEQSTPDAMEARRSPDGNMLVSRNQPYQAPLVFLRTDVLGVDIGGSLADQGLQFTLGYGNRNIALIPTHATAGNGKIVPIFGGSRREDGTFNVDDPTDAMSVLGQFKSNTETQRLGLDLGRYFSTGVAARLLGKSLTSSIAKVPMPPASASAQ
ncbi:hypothetical protein [Pseudorhodoferax sp.]|uniref:hypothetical protein n=1 Tax=Pseudorhodoferax sp. TaxID=1993553 RepID=UPI002DD63FD1|nr:hypothetical protein [Pseudorhodoferax sp.]